MSRFVKLNQLVVNVPKQEIMGKKKEMEFKIGTMTVDISQICAYAYQINDFENVSKDDEEFNNYCKANNLTLVKLITKDGLTFASIINPRENYFEDLLDVQTFE